MKRSAGLLMYRRSAGRLEVLLVHPGGPFWVKKDDGAWSIPKGHIEPEEDPLAAAVREFEEETGSRPQGDFQPLAPVRLKSGKIIHAWMIEGDFDVAEFKSAPFQMEWPPKSGRESAFPEADRAAWFSIEEATRKISQGQRAFVDELQAKLCPGRKSLIRC